MNKCYYVYILSNKKNGTLYVGVTSDLKKRIFEHKNHFVEGFTTKYNIDLLIYYESFTTSLDAIAREKQLKWWKRKWKIDLIELNNPDWKDLYEEII